MLYKKIKYNNMDLIRINKRKAINILSQPKKHNGIIVYMLPVNANPESPWIKGFFEIECNQYNDSIDNITQVNEIQYYNCNDELGSYLKYYIEVDPNA